MPSRLIKTPSKVWPKSDPKWRNVAGRVLAASKLSSNRLPRDLHGRQIRTDEQSSKISARVEEAAEGRPQPSQAFRLRLTLSWYRCLYRRTVLRDRNHRSQLRTRFIGMDLQLAAETSQAFSHARNAYTGPDGREILQRDSSALILYLNAKGTFVSPDANPRRQAAGMSMNIG